jgi:uncharacterized membrane protein
MQAVGDIVSSWCMIASGIGSTIDKARVVYVSQDSKYLGVASQCCVMSCGGIACCKCLCLGKN